MFSVVFFSFWAQLWKTDLFSVDLFSFCAHIWKTDLFSGAFSSFWPQLWKSNVFSLVFFNLLGSALENRCVFCSLFRLLTPKIIFLFHEIESGTQITRGTTSVERCKACWSTKLPLGKLVARQLAPFSSNIWVHTDVTKLSRCVLDVHIRHWSPKQL